MKEAVWALALVSMPMARADEPPAQLIALSASGGWNLQTRQPWAGLDLAFRHDGTRGARFLGGLRGGWAFFDERPRFDLDAGVMGVLPTEQLIRLGAAVGAQLAITPFDLPLAIGGDVDGYGRVSILPYGYLATEIGFQRPDAKRGAHAWSVGIRVGASASAALVACEDDPDEECLGTGVAFLGGVTARIRFHEGVYLEAMAGPSAFLNIGYAFPVGRRTPVDDEAEAEDETAEVPPTAVVEEGPAPPPGDVVPDPAPAAEPAPTAEPEPADEPAPETADEPAPEPADAPADEAAPEPTEDPAPEPEDDLYDGFLQSP